MDTSWWISKDELDPAQQEFIKLPASGRYQLEGPAGSGKTNLLLLRAQFVAGQGEKNVLVITYTNALCDFLRSGLAGTGLIEGDQVRTFHSWAVGHIGRYLKTHLVEKGADFDEDTRAHAVELLKQANEKLPAKNIYSSIFVDEAQDLTVEELRCLLSLSENVCVCGDIKQGIYQRDGLDIAADMGLEKHTLTRHYRIGQRIAQVADRLLEPPSPAQSLEATSNYNPKIQGTPSAELHRCIDRDEQFSKLCELLAVQLVAFTGEKIGIFCGKRSTAAELAERFEGTEFEKNVCYHATDTDGFASDARIHIMTMHSAKGVEFRAVHLFGIEVNRPVFRGGCLV
ncbi:UvrD/REP helicase N-terminal domain-containing protein [Dyella jiangningensis]|uniref:UvrD-helicase domain-containing protein n=1 Tax=Dyella sp. AtDHG13 TaxID=1938897 RepID=UPI00087E30DD|nr:UvrD-helicase domain-containing protein [Dyella sp. AtDHG13]PXV52085.1 UvrD-like helicase family protein [Dyella sp. AtDHG13]SDL55974.1 UvrD/REP helicase N-terminal domain-containing protein [Dyella jiangningensis]